MKRYFINSIGLNPELEHPGILQPRPLGGTTQKNGLGRDNENLRRADIFIPRWRRGTLAALDFAVTSGLHGDLVDKSAQQGSAPTEAYENFKCQYLETEESCKAEGITFIPIICEADGGGWGPAANKAWSELTKTKALLTGERTSSIVNRLLQSLGLILHRENSRAILRRFPNNMDDNYRELLAASTACGTNTDHQG